MDENSSSSFLSSALALVSVEVVVMTDRLLVPGIISEHVDSHPLERNYRTLRWINYFSAGVIVFEKEDDSVE